MFKQIALAAALAIGTIGVTSSADAGYGHKRHYGFKSYGYSHSYAYRPYAYSYRHYKPVYTHRYYKPVCSHWGWGYRHGFKVRKCLW